MKVLEGKDQHILAVFDRGEKIVAGLTQVAKTHQVDGATLFGLGALEKVELGYYDLHKKEYLRKTFDETDYELISLQGNFSWRDGDYFTHVHASLSGPDFKVFGGHLLEAEVAVTAEVSIIPLGRLPERKANESIGLDLICGFR